MTSKMPVRKRLLLLCSLCGLLTLPARAQFALPASVAASGAIDAQGSSFRLTGTVGQVAVGHASGGAMSVAMGFWFTTAPTADNNPTPIETDAGAAIPRRVVLDQNYPNPFNPTTTIPYGVPVAGPVRLTVYDLLGREVAVLVEATQAPGTYHVTLDATGWPSGVYLYRLAVGNEVLIRRLTLLK